MERGMKEEHMYEVDMERSSKYMTEYKKVLPEDATGEFWSSEDLEEMTGSRYCSRVWHEDGFVSLVADGVEAFKLRRKNSKSCPQPASYDDLIGTVKYHLEAQMLEVGLVYRNGRIKEYVKPVDQTANSLPNAKQAMVSEAFKIMRKDYGFDNGFSCDYSNRLVQIAATARLVNKLKLYKQIEARIKKKYTKQTLIKLKNYVQSVEAIK